MSLHDRIKEARKNKGLTQEQLGNLIGVAKTTITGYEKNREPSAAKLGEIADALGVDVNFLYQDEVKEFHKNRATVEELEKLVKPYRLLDSHGQELVDMVLIKETERMKSLGKEALKDSYIFELPTENIIHPTRTLNYYQRLASAGTGQIVFDDVPVDLIEIPDVPEYERVKYAIGVNGDSMEPLYYDGDILLVEPMQDVRVNDIGIFIVDGESLVKKRGKTSLISLNQNKNYAEIPLNEETRCLGRVVDKITCPNNLYAALTEDDKAALEQGAAVLRAQAFSFDEKMDDMDIEESLSSKKHTSSHPDMSAFTPEDLKALENGRIKMFRPGKNA